jgi:hypothetical protein
MRAARDMRECLETQRFSRSKRVTRVTRRCAHTRARNARVAVRVHVQKTLRNDLTNALHVTA